MFVFKIAMWSGMCNIYGSKVGASYHKIPPTRIKNKENVKLQLTIEKTCQSSRYLLKCPSSSNTFSTDIFWRRVCVRWLPVRLSLAGSSSWADQHQIMNGGLHESRVGGADTYTRLLTDSSSWGNYLISETLVLKKNALSSLPRYNEIDNCPKSF